MRFLFPAFAFLVAQTATADALDKAILGYMKSANVPGVSLAVIKDGKPVKVKGYGFANLEHRVPVTPETLFQTGSVGKQFTAALVMKLVQEGKIVLDESIRAFFPETPKSWERITIRHLLTHTSGLPDPYDVLDLRKDYSEAELLEIDAKLPLQFQPGENWSYSNTGYHLLGFLCSKVGGKFYGDQLVEKILRPAGMKTARIIDEAAIVMHRAAGYEPRDGTIFNQAWVSPKLNTTADGSLYVSILDMIQWDAALNGDKLLSAEVKRQMWSPVKLTNGTTRPYGFGWSLAPYNGRKLISHNGAWQGFRTSIMRFVDDKLTVIVLANSASANPDKIARMAAGHFVPTLKPVEAKPVAEKDPMVRELLLRLLDGTAADAHKLLSPEMKERVTVSRLESVLSDLRAAGKRSAPVLIAATEENGVRSYQYRVSFGTETVVIQLSLNSKNEIAGLMLSEE